MTTETRMRTTINVAMWAKAEINVILHKIVNETGKQTIRFKLRAINLLTLIDQRLNLQCF